MITEQQSLSAARTIHQARFGDEAVESEIQATARELLAVNVEEQNPMHGRFHSIRYTPAHHKLVVCTSPVILEFVNLGSFEISLTLNLLRGEIDSKYCTTIRAMQPHEHVGYSNPHPHVSNNLLCYGEGRTPASNALARGDIMGCLRIANAVLHTYNPASPYRSIATYRGPECFDCGGVVIVDTVIAQRSNVEHGWICNPCGNKVCNNCVTPCYCCKAGICSDCVKVYKTPISGDIVCCGRCLEYCGNCSENLVPKVDDYKRTVRTRYYGDRDIYYCEECLEHMP